MLWNTIATLYNFTITNDLHVMIPRNVVQAFVTMHRLYMTVIIIIHKHYSLPCPRS